MKQIKTVLKELLPLLVSMTAWLWGFRPVTALIAVIDPHLKVPASITEPVKVGWDISFLLFVLGIVRMTVRRPRLLSLQGRIVNDRTLSKRTYLTPSDDSPGQPETLRLLVQAHLLRAWFVRWLQAVGGVLLVVRRPSKTISIDLDARYAGDRDLFTRSRERWPAISLLELFDDRPAELDLDYLVSVMANGMSTQTGTIQVEVWPQTENGIRFWAATILIWLFVVTDIDDHTVHIQPNTRR